ncbi:CBASS cGAMP-activated phospholipase [Amycolatopsis thermoflava]|uniref:CBASS cGAMP-activated phospholipase n=1 Tax=Amycolatopsis thermoflava TaxID=84480 RepID=UPI0036657695
MATSSFYNILALDGGGLRGIFTASVLAEAEAAFGPAFISEFDLLVGTSTGGILALGLASGYSCEQMLQFYRQIGPRVFSKPRRLSRLFRPKYDRRQLDHLLREHFGETKYMNELAKPVCITSHEVVSGTPRVWKDDHSPELRWGGDQLVWKVAAATSAAPTYFAPIQLGHADSHVDGGVWVNNPALVGIIEAVRYAGKDLQEIRLLSIGTTSKAFRIQNHKAAARLGTLGWATKALDLLQGSSSMAANYQAQLLLGNERYLRLDCDSADKVRLDDAEQCNPLEEWGHDIGRKNIPRISQLLNLSSPR